MTALDDASVVENMDQGSPTVFFHVFGPEPVANASSTDVPIKHQGKAQSPSEDQRTCNAAQDYGGDKRDNPQVEIASHMNNSNIDDGGNKKDNPQKNNSSHINCRNVDGDSDNRSMTSKLENSATPNCSDGGESDTPAQNRTMLTQAWKLNIPFQGAKKLLVLDVNGFLVSSYKKMDKTRPRNIEHRVVGSYHVFKRPFCESFLQFCFENFHVGIWSSVQEVNVHKAVDFVCKEMKDKLAFIMHQTDCTDTGLKAPENRFKPLFLKELTKVWTSFRPGEFNPSNTLLVDDSPYKALRNPPFTAVHPETYTHNTDDNFLSGPLQVFLEGLRDAADVQQFVRDHPIGVPAITVESLHWNLYRKIVTVDNLSPQIQNVLISNKQESNPSIYEPPRRRRSTSSPQRKDSRHVQTRSPRAANVWSRMTEALSLAAAPLFGLLGFPGGVDELATDD